MEPNVNVKKESESPPPPSQSPPGIKQEVFDFQVQEEPQAPPQSTQQQPQTLQQQQTGSTNFLLQNLLRTLRSPTTPEQQQQVLRILKSNPQLMADFIRHRQAQQQVRLNQPHSSQTMQQPPNYGYQQTPPIRPVEPLAQSQSYINSLTDQLRALNEQVKILEGQNRSLQEQNTFLVDQINHLKK